jgi:hypothetical protein
VKKSEDLIISSLKSGLIKELIIKQEGHSRKMDCFQVNKDSRKRMIGKHNDQEAKTYNTKAPEVLH